MVELESALDDTLAIGEGTILPLRGVTSLSHGQRARRFHVTLGSERHSLPHTQDVRPELEARDREQGTTSRGFWLPIPLGKELAGRTARLHVELVLSDDTRIDVVDRQIALVERPTIATAPRSAKIVICLATYNPDAELFARQIASLRAQTLTDWICIVEDDGSRPDAFAAVERTCAEDSRFFVFRNVTNRGFYRNFESCMWRVPKSAEYVALCDQDDEWLPEKLEVCLSRLSGTTQMVYSDMRLVDRDRKVLAETYWTSRRNNFRSFETLLVSNTVTGAASLFRRSLLDRVLPFPIGGSEMFHDHWLACSSVVAGGLDYIDRPLYDYVQHGSNVIGYCGFESLDARGQLRNHAATIAELVRHPERRRPELEKSLATYYGEFRKLHLYRMLFLQRYSHIALRHRRSLSMFAGGLAGALRLMVPAHLGVLRRGDTTNMQEMRLGVSVAVHKLATLTGVF